MRAFLLSLALALSILTVGAAVPAPPPPLLYSVPDRGLEEQVSLQLWDVPLREALRVLFRGTRSECRVGSDVPDTRITAALPSAGRAAALQEIVRRASANIPDLSLSLENGYAVLRRKASDAPTPLVNSAQVDDKDPAPRLLIRRYGAGDQLRVDTDIREIPLRQALDGLFAGTGQTYTIEKGIPDFPVWLRTENTALANAARWTVRMAAVRIPGLVTDRDEGGYHVRITDHPEQRPVERLTVGLHDPGLTQRRVTLDLRQATLREAFRQVLQNSGFALQVDSEVPDARITLRLDQTPVPEAAQQLRQAFVREIPDLTVSTRDDVVLIQRADVERARLLRQLHP